MRRPGIWAANGSPSDPELMLSWRPGALTCFYDYLQPNRVLSYKAQHPGAVIVVRINPGDNWQTWEPKQYAEFIVSKWPDMKEADPYVFFANETNLHYENGDPNGANQHLYETPEHYRKFGQWVYDVSAVVKDKAPDMKLAAPPFAFGHGEDGEPDADGNPKRGWAGYDWLADAVREFCDGVICFHSYWGPFTGGRAGLYDRDLSTWYAFRYRRVIDLFRTRYRIEPRIIIDEAGNFDVGAEDFTDQIIYHATHVLRDPEVIALTYFLWEDPTHAGGNEINSWQNARDLRQHLRRLAALPDIPTGPRRPRASAIRGVVRDENGRPCRKAKVMLRAGLWNMLATTNDRGEYNLQGLDAGTFDVEVLDTGVARTGVALDGTTAAEIDFTVPVRPTWQMEIERRPGPRLLIGKLPQPDIPVTVADPWENRVQVLSGSKPEYGPGGFEVSLWQSNRYTISFEDEHFGEIEIGDETAIVTFSLGIAEGEGEKAEEKPKEDEGVAATAEGEKEKGEEAGEVVATAAGMGEKKEEEATESAAPAGGWKMEIERKPGNRLLVGVLPEADIPVTVTGAWGNKVEITSGSKPEYGPGGFEVAPWAAPRYTIAFEGQEFTVELGQETLIATFTREAEKPAEGAGVAAAETTAEEKAWAMDVTRQPGLRLLIGRLPEAGVEVTIADGDGNEATVISGSRPEHGPGGFEVPLWHTGTFAIRFGDQKFEVEVGDETVTATFRKE